MSTFVNDLSDNELLTKIFEGDFINLPLINSKIVRIFTSSTFTGILFFLPFCVQKIIY